MSVKVGERVGAVLSQETDAKDGTIVTYFLGYGVYEGGAIPPKGVTMGGIDMHTLCTNLGRTNPCILLDSGKRVYGCECWWGSEKAVQKALAGAARVVHIDIDAARAEAESILDG